MFLTRNNQNDYLEWLENANINGSFALIDKDKDWTSFDVVAKLRSTTKIKKVGHTGTLDPLATGLLIICFGKATKKSNDYLGLPKKYRANVKLGATTKTDDSEADEENIKQIDDLSEELVRDTISSFIGKIMQRPPMYSAKKVKGQRLYKLARKNEEIEIQEVEVEIYSIDNTSIDLPFVQFDVKCSKGTYIRSLARDIGEKLGKGGYLYDLRRTDIGDYNISDSLSVNEFVDLHRKNKDPL
jgi:tRNA pseudouridine55 synthase